MFKDNGLDDDDDILGEDLEMIENISFLQNLISKFLELYRAYLIMNDNNKLRYFHLLVAFTLFYDFYLTGIILANYEF